jgi:hypothetical protein
MLNAQEMLRIALFSGLVGFAVFCASYAITVWTKRNRGNANPGFRLFSSVAVMGAVGLGGFWATNELVPREGVVEGKDLFVVHSRRDANLHHLTDAGPVKKGDVLAEFIPPAIEAQLSILDNRIAEARTRIQSLELRSLPIEPLLVQQQWYLRGELDRLRAFAFDLRRSLRELDKEELAHQTQWTRERSHLNAEMETARRDRESYVARLKLAEEAVVRMSDLQKRGIVSAQLVDDRNVNLLSLKLDRERSEDSIQATRARLAALEERYSSHSAAINKQRERLSTDLQQVEQSAAILSKRVTHIADEIKADQQRAKAANDTEIQTSRHQLAALNSERDRVIAGTRVAAPSDGQVVYRHPAPGFVADAAPVLAISAGSGFGARVLIPAKDIDKIAAAGHVQFSLDRSPLHRYFVGEYKRYETIPQDPTKVITHFDVQLPREVITALASATDNSLPIRLEWRPNVVVERPFQVGMFAVAFGIFGAFASTALVRLKA